MHRPLWIFALAITAFGLPPETSQAQQQVTLLGFEELQGTVESTSPGRLVIKDSDGKAVSLRIQQKDQQTVALSGSAVIRYPADVQVTGVLAAKSLKPGQQVQVEVEMNRLGRVRGEVRRLSLVGGEDEAAGVEPLEEGNEPGAQVRCRVVGVIGRLLEERLIIKVPPSEFTRKTTLAVPMAAEAEVHFASDDYRRAGPGAVVRELTAARFSTGDLVVKTLRIEVADTTASASRAEERLAVKYRHLSDEPVAPRQIRSAHFLLVSDISERQAAILLEKLETMVGLLSNYFGQPPTNVIRGFVVHDLSAWPDGVLTEPQGIERIRAGAGICFQQSLGNQRSATLYACDDHGVVQHEATHAYCGLAFGSTGPTWLAEGVAEMGQYWKADQRAVDIDPRVIAYIRNSRPQRTLAEIAVPGRVEAGGWQDYAWRWALCHLLANNPNYSDRFKPLAIALMSRRVEASFAAVYGPLAPQISFEYDQFLQHLDNGYRADLCAWQWNRDFKPLQSGRNVKTTVAARGGWQASGVRLEAGLSYDVAAQGTWKIAGDGAEFDADGDATGRGRLVAAILDANLRLSPPIELGKRATWQAPSDGQLYLRCREHWNRLEDNDGQLQVWLRRTPE